MGGAPPKRLLKKWIRHGKWQQSEKDKRPPQVITHYIMFRNKNLSDTKNIVKVDDFVNTHIEFKVIGWPLAISF